MHPHERRLRNLERLGVAIAAGPDRWKVSPNLVQELTKRASERAPRHRVRLHKEPLSVPAQVHHPGPAWLNRVKADALAAYGFGAEVNVAVERRREVLRRLGVQPDDPNRTARLRELERRAVGGEIASRSGQAFLPSAPDAFRGRVQVAEVGPSHGAYAVVSDGQRFLVLRASAALRTAYGRTVTVTQDARGRLAVRPAAD